MAIIESRCLKKIFFMKQGPVLFYISHEFENCFLLKIQFNSISIELNWKWVWFDIYCTLYTFPTDPSPSILGTTTTRITGLWASYMRIKLYDIIITYSKGVCNHYQYHLHGDQLFSLTFLYIHGLLELCRDRFTILHPLQGLNQSGVRWALYTLL